MGLLHSFIIRLLNCGMIGWIHSPLLSQRNTAASTHLIIATKASVAKQLLWKVRRSYMETSRLSCEQQGHSHSHSHSNGETPAGIWVRMGVDSLASRAVRRRLRLGSALATLGAGIGGTRHPKIILFVPILLCFVREIGPASK